MFFGSYGSGLYLISHSHAPAWECKLWTLRVQLAGRFVFRLMNSGNKKSSRITIIPPNVLLGAYASGIFPMADSETGPVEWYSADPRAVIPLDSFRTTRSLRQTMKKGIYRVLTDTAFEQVMRACAEREETWISETIIQSYLELFKLGFAHSVESWHAGVLVGGLYGVSLGGAFFGESMFSRKTDASKVALVHLVQRLRDRGFTLLDTQFSTTHLEQFGTIEIPRDEYMRQLNEAIVLQRTFVEAQDEFGIRNSDFGI